MTITRVKGNTFALEDRQCIGLYQIDDKTCLLFDPASRNYLEAVEESLQELGLTPVGIVCTHMHYDHHETSNYFREKYGAKVCLPQLEADIVRSPESVKNHLYNFTLGMVRKYRRLDDLICPVDRVIAFGETEFDFCGVKLGVLRTPGHSPDHVCFITPDNVCFAGDTLMTEKVMETAQIPFAFDIGEDLASKERMARQTCDACILCHSGILYGSCAELARKNIALFERKIAEYKALVTKPMTYSAFHSAVLRSVGLAPGHPVRALHLERYIRPYWDYLIDTEQVELTEVDGAAAIIKKQEYR